MNINSHIVVEDLHKSFSGRLVLNGINLSINKGESFVLIGRSGAGKSVFLSILSGLMTHDSGVIRISDVNLSMNPEIVSKDVGYLFQEVGLFSDMTLWENIAFHYLYGEILRRNIAKDLAIEAMSKVGISSDVAYLYPHQISGGMQKKIGIARAIARKCKILLLDEPTSNLDPISAGEITKLLKKCNTELGMTILSVMHDLGSMRVLGDKVAMLHGGRFVWQGTQSEFFESKDELLVNFINMYTGIID